MKGKTMKMKGKGKGMEDETEERKTFIRSLDPNGDDSLMDELLASNPEFQAVVAKSKAGPRKPFPCGERRPTNG